MSKRSMKNWKHWRGSVHQHKTEHKNIWTAELMKSQVDYLAVHQESVQEEEAMSKTKEDQIEQWRLGIAERRKDLGKVES